MNDLETRLRASFQHQVEAPPAAPSLAGPSIARGRRTRRAQAFAAAASVVAIAATAGVLVSGGGSSRAVVPGTSPEPSPSSGAQPQGGVADAAWVQALRSSSGGHSIGAAVGRELYFAGRKVVLDGDAIAVTVVPTGAVVTFHAEGSVETSFFRNSDSTPFWTVGNTSYGHAVDPTGTKVALGVDGRRRVVVDLATGDIADDLNTFKPNDEGMPVAWTSSGVLVSAGDGGDGHADLWQPTTGANRRLGRTGEYGSAQDMLGDVVALHENDGSCVNVSRLSQVGGTDVGCQGEARLGAAGELVLLWGEGTATVVKVDTKAQAPLRAPAQGVVSASLRGASQVDLAVRAVDGAGRPLVLVVSCATDDQPCHRELSLDDHGQALVMARFVGF